MVSSIRRLILIACAVACSAAAAAAPPLPADVEAFRRERAICEHFLGEEAYDAERGAYIKRQIESACPGTDQRLAALKRKYASNRRVSRALAGYAPTLNR